MAQASALLRVGYDAQRQCTQLLESYAEPPLQWLFPNDDGLGLRATLVQLGGILQGDRYHLRIELQERAFLRLTTQAATKLYRMPEQPAQQRVEVHLGANAFFCYLPDEVIPFAGSDFDQRIDVHLEKGARAVLWEVLTPGRTGIGEIFRYRRYQTRLCVWHAGSTAPLLWENQVFHPREAPLDRAAAFGVATHLGSFWYLTERVDDTRSALRQAAEKRLFAADPLHQPYAFEEPAPTADQVSLKKRAPLYGGVTLLPAGLLVRVLGEATAPIQSLFAQLLTQLWLKQPSADARGAG